MNAKDVQSCETLVFLRLTQATNDTYYKLYYLEVVDLVVVCMYVIFRYYCEKGIRCISNDVNNHLTDFFLGFLGGFTESLLSMREGVLVPLEASALTSSL